MRFQLCSGMPNVPAVRGTQDPEEGRCAPVSGEGRPAADLRCPRLRQEAQGQHLAGRSLDLARRALAPQGSTRGLRAQGLGEGLPAASAL